MIPSLQLPAEQVMATNGKSFYFASVFFSRSQMQRIARLYQICRYVDDCADELAPALSKQVIARLRQEIEDPTLTSEFQQAVNELASWGVRREDLRELLLGAEFDQGLVRIKDQEEFLRYCYWVAGVVGLMMCPLLGCSDKQASPFARDLGMAMQMTNICRDVLEDAQNDRIYLSTEIDQIPQCKAKASATHKYRLKGPTVK